MKFRLGTLALLVVGLGYYFWPTPLEKQLGKQFETFANAAALDKPLTAIEARFKAKELVAILDDSVWLHYQSSDEDFTRTFTKKEALDGASAALIQLDYLKTAFSKLKLLRYSRNEAGVSIFLIAEWKQHGDTAVSQAAEDLKLNLEHQGGAWIITRIETLPRATLDLSKQN